MTAPERSLKQRRDALDKANVIRTKRAALKRDLKGGRKSVVDLLTEPPDYIGTMKLWDLLIATPKFGRVAVNKALVRCRISPAKTIGGLSVRQRAEVVSLIEMRPIPKPAATAYSREYQRQYRAYCRGEGPKPMSKHDQMRAAT